MPLGKLVSGQSLTAGAPRNATVTVFVLRTCTSAHVCTTACPNAPVEDVGLRGLCAMLRHFAGQASARKTSGEDEKERKMDVERNVNLVIIPSRQPAYLKVKIRLLLVQREFDSVTPMEMIW